MARMEATTNARDDYTRLRLRHMRLTAKLSSNSDKRGAGASLCTDQMPEFAEYVPLAHPQLASRMNIWRTSRIVYQPGG